MPTILEASLSRNQQSILIADDAANWFESGPIRDVTVRGNRFFHCGEPAVVAENGNHRNLCVEGNEYIMDGYLALVARHVQGVTFRGNKIPTANPPSNVRQIAILDACTGVVLEDNTIEKLKP